MRQLKVVLISLFLLSIVGCKEDPKVIVAEPVDTGVSTFYFIRHAEKDRSNSENSDPELTQRGLGRAMHWAEILKDVELDAIYSTDYNRTSMTAAPTSVKQDVDVEYYDPRIIDFEQFKVENLNRTVLVVGHSNTTPDFVNNMIGEEKYPAMDDDDNGSLFVVQLANGAVISQRLHISCNCPD
ncbi:histidine phosphatase family protein [Maribacter algarum]|uniref:Histidine phosphatase family protein n=1 Tax=Maribacter algarum (ex Zhang et al. 2020) TaxID=2578118 RepID=A0A5S3PQA2_9FLAO|nr:phosphoglycerate mutase family protein [Maribacter algarum]TMM56927.1 histidine phosphatase family protein [Maribacter algarum]